MTNNATPMMETAAIVLLLTILYQLWRRLRLHFERKKPFDGLPMAADSHFILGHVKNVVNIDFCVNHAKLCYDQADDNGICSFWLMGSRGVSVTRWEDARAILQASADHFNFALAARHVRKFVGRRSLFGLNGREWKQQRAAVIRVFHSSSTLMNSRESVVDVSQTLVDALKKRSQSQTWNVATLMKMVTMDVFGRTALSCDFGCCEKLQPSPFAVAFEYLGQDLMRRLQSPLLPSNLLYALPTAENRRQAQERTVIRKYLIKLVAERQSEKPADRKPDLLTSLLKAHTELKEQVTEEMLVDVLMALLFAGYDTTSITLMYALYIVASHPEVEGKCLEEIERVWREDGNLSNPDRLVYCSGVISETLRMFPPAVAVNRKIAKPLQLSNGFIIPDDTIVFIPIYMIHHDPRHFERPDEFHAERWVKRGNGDERSVWVERVMDDTDGGATRIAAGNRNAIFSFSGGARSCAAQKFAIQEAVLVLATLVKQLKFDVKPGYVPVPKRNGIVQSPEEGMPMTITPRDSLK